MRWQRPPTSSFNLRSPVGKSERGKKVRLSRSVSRQARPIPSICSSSAILRRGVASFRIFRGSQGRGWRVPPASLVCGEKSRSWGVFRAQNGIGGATESPRNLTSTRSGVAPRGKDLLQFPHWGLPQRGKMICLLPHRRCFQSSSLAPLLS